MNSADYDLAKAHFDRFTSDMHTQSALLARELTEDMWRTQYCATSDIECLRVRLEGSSLISHNSSHPWERFRVQVGMRGAEDVRASSAPTERLVSCIPSHNIEWLAKACPEYRGIVLDGLAPAPEYFVRARVYERAQPVGSGREERYYLGHWWLVRLMSIGKEQRVLHVKPLHGKYLHWPRVVRLLVGCAGMRDAIIALLTMQSPWGEVVYPRTNVVTLPDGVSALTSALCGWLGLDTLEPDHPHVRYWQADDSRNPSTQSRQVRVGHI